MNIRSYVLCLVVGIDEPYVVRKQTLSLQNIQSANSDADHHF